MMNVMNYQEYDAILNVFDAINKKDPKNIDGCLDGKFKTMVLKQEVNRDEYLDVYQKFKSGMPDLVFKVVDLSTDGESFKANIKITGTHTHTIPSLKSGWKKMKPTGKKVDKIVSSIEIILHNDRIREIRNLKKSKGVFAGLLSELDLLPKSYLSN